MKKIKRILSLLLAMVMIMSAVGFDAIAESLDGVPEGYTGIYTVEDLYNIRNDLTGNYILMNDIDLTEATAEGGEYDFNGNGWNPIGSNDTYGYKAFKGIFDGNGHSIVGFKMNVVNKPTTLNSNNYYGLFAYNSGTICNLTMFGSITGGFEENVKYCGAISGYNSGTIKNCTNNCNISLLGLEGEKTTYTVYCGGITGETSGTIEECVNNGDITAANDSFSHRLAGITSYKTSNSAVIKNCYNTGTIKSGYYAGGIVANGYSSCINCYNIGEVIGDKRTVQISNSESNENCYYIENGTESTQTGVSVLTSEQMKSESSFEGFDFGGVWAFEDNGYPYPQLKNNYLTDVNFDSIRIKKSPDATLISYNTELDMSGCIIELLLGEEVVGVRGVTPNMVGGYDKTKLGVQTLTISLNDISTSFVVEVKHYCDIYGHDADWVTTIVPTETTKGEKIKKCLVCGKSFEIEEIPVIPVGYYGVYDPESLNNMRNDLGGNYVLLCDVDMTKATAKGGSCDNGGKGWIPVGTDATYSKSSQFTGSLNGNFHKIIGLRINLVNTETVDPNIGLFLYVTGTVKNLFVEDVNINVDTEDMVYLGTIAGSNYGTIDSVVTSGRIDVKNSGYIGGIIGRAIKENDYMCYALICNSINYVNIYSNYQSNHIGGISGRNGNISCCANYGNITAINNATLCAGIRPVCDVYGGDVTNCYNAGDITSYSVSIGITDINGDGMVIEDCYNVGKVKTSNDNGLTWNLDYVFDNLYSVDTCYYLDGTSVGGGGATRLSYEEMLVQSNYEGFSFGDVWYFDQNDEDYPYPKLKAHIFGDNCDHSYTEWIIDSEPTCDTVGVKHQFCVLCKDVIVEETPALGHDYFDEFTIEKEGTCSESGIKYRSCSRCTDKVDITIIPPTGHDYSEWIVDVEATCTTAGLQSSTCATCGDVQTSEIEPYGHTYSSRWTTDVAPTCTEVGSKSHHCLRCGDKSEITEIPATGHDFTDWFVDTPPTCTGTGANYRACKTCGIEELQDVSATGHTVGEWITEIEPSCTTEGSKYKLCSECDTKIYESIAPLGHNYSDSWTIDVEATCITAGSKSHHCIRCNEKSNITVIDAYGHSYSENWTVDIEATCIEDGSKSHHCLRCDDKTDITPIKATGHSYGTWILDIAPTCTETGVKYRVCASCDATETELLRKLTQDPAPLSVPVFAQRFCVPHPQWVKFSPISQNG